MFGWGKDKKKDKSPWSSKDYIAKELKKKDAENFAAAGILVFNSNGPASLEMLLGRNCTKNELEFLGGKRDDREDVFTTAAREFDEETGGILGDIKKDLSHRTLLVKACKDKESSVLWYSKGRYALFLVPAAKLLNLVVFESPGDTLPKRHKAFVQSGKVKSKSSSFQEMQELVWMTFANPQLSAQQKVREFMRSVFECAVFKVWLHSSIYGQKPHTLYLSGLDWNTKEKDLKAIFDQVGPCKISLESHADSSYKTNGKGTVSFDDRHHATTAVYLLNKSSYCGRPLSLKWEPEPASPPLPSAHGGGGASAHTAPSHAAAVGGSGSSTPGLAVDNELPGFQPNYEQTHGIRGKSSTAQPLPPAHAAQAMPPPHVTPAAPPAHAIFAPAMSSALPVGWIEQSAPDGTPFYVYTPTAHVQWNRPPAPPPQPSVTPAPPPIAPPYAHAPPPPPDQYPMHVPPPPPPASSQGAPPPPPPQTAFMDRQLPPPTGSYGQYPGPPSHSPPAY